MSVTNIAKAVTIFAFYTPAGAVCTASEEGCAAAREIEGGIVEDHHIGLLQAELQHMLGPDELRKPTSTLARGPTESKQQRRAAWHKLVTEAADRPAQSLLVADDTHVEQSASAGKHADQDHATPFRGQGSCPSREEPGPPPNAVAYNGITWPAYCFVTNPGQEEHFYLMGDYGGVMHPLSTHNDQVEVANNVGNTNQEWPRKFVWGIDEKVNYLVAAAMNKRALTSQPRFVLNAGDNFYWSGVDTICGTPMNNIENQTLFQFEYVFEKMYTGPFMDNAPWFSVFGNHDWGGYVFNHAWDQEIAYTWATAATYPAVTGRWTQPALYWKTTVNYPTAGFSVDLFMVDANINDVYPYESNPGHNICGWHNAGSADCSAIGGPQNAHSCGAWFDNLWNQELAWLEESLNASTADWQIVVTHYPPDKYEMSEHMVSTWNWLSSTFGIDLIVASHRHDQEIWMNGVGRSATGGTPYVVCGGGGGITSEHEPTFTQTQDFGSNGGPVVSQYGFMDVTISQTSLKIEAIDEWGDVKRVENVKPRPPTPSDGGQWKR